MYYIAHVTTDSLDNYFYLFDYKPTIDECVERVYNAEGQIEELDWYRNTTHVNIEEVELITSDFRNEN